MTDASIGHGSLFELHDGESPGEFEELAEVYSITPPSDTVDVVDATHLQSPNRTREKIDGLIDPGEASFEMNFVANSDTDAKIQAWKASGGRRSCRITFPNSVTWTFDGILTGYEPEVPVDDRMTATVTINVTGSYNVGAAAAPTNTVLPAVSGIAQVGETLTALTGVWTGAPTFTYVWEEDDGDGYDPITGATGKTYDPVVGNVGNPVRVVVTGTNSAGNDSATSQPTADVLAAD